MLLAGAAFVSPNMAKPPAAPKQALAPATVARTAPPLSGLVTTLASFRLRPSESDFDDLIAEAAKRYGLPPAVIRAVIRAESAFDPLAVSSAGAQGLMQLMPAVAEELGVKDSFDPRQNIMAGSQYLSTLLGDQNGDLALALASYNAGPGNVLRYQGMPPFKETQNYVRKILDSVAEADDNY